MFILKHALFPAALTAGACWAFMLGIYTIAVLRALWTAEGGRDGDGTSEGL